MPKVVVHVVVVHVRGVVVIVGIATESAEGVSVRMRVYWTRGGVNDWPADPAYRLRRV